ncbi:putative serine/threonine-protein kinase [Sesbania bispinosa]|nr:putative serine/threonine-protein kinase [Sesbania bispinosa]
MLRERLKGRHGGYGKDVYNFSFYNGTRKPALSLDQSSMSSNYPLFFISSIAGSTYSFQLLFPLQRMRCGNFETKMIRFLV